MGFQLTGKSDAALDVEDDPHSLLSSSSSALTHSSPLCPPPATTTLNPQASRELDGVSERETEIKRDMQAASSRVVQGSTVTSHVMKAGRGYIDCFVSGSWHNCWDVHGKSPARVSPARQGPSCHLATHTHLALVERAYDRKPLRSIESILLSGSLNYEWRVTLLKNESAM